MKYLIPAASLTPRSLSTIEPHVTSFTEPHDFPSNISITVETSEFVKAVEILLSVLMSYRPLTLGVQVYHTVSVVVVLTKGGLASQLVTGSIKFSVADVIGMGVVENGNEIVEGMTIASTHSSFGGTGGVFATPKVTDLLCSNEFSNPPLLVGAEIEKKYFFPAVTSKGETYRLEQVSDFKSLQSSPSNIVISGSKK